MATYENKWFEVWYSDGEDIIPTHLLIVISDPKQANKILIVDPSENHRVVFEAKDYDAATDWLVEDEYSLAGGRQFPDDGWPLPTAGMRAN
jgi:hypothetical protein